MRTLMLIAMLIGASCAASPPVLDHVSDKGATPQERLARCLTRKGAKLYSCPTWCRPCQEQEALFGDARQLLTVVSCEKPGDVYEESDACKQAGIANYPTWEFASGKRLKGAYALFRIAAEAGCPWNP